MVIVHIKGIDEVSRTKDVEKKVQAIESVDAYLVGPLVEEIQCRDIEFRFLVMPPFPTYIRMGDSMADAVPYMLYDSGIEVVGCNAYSEKLAKDTGNYFDEGYLLINHLLEDN